MKVRQYQRQRLSTIMTLVLLITATCLCHRSASLSQVSAFQGSSTVFLPRIRHRNSITRLSSTIISTDNHSPDNDDASSKPNYDWTKQSFAIAIPALIGMLADPLLSLMDTGYVGRLGSLELAALGPCTSIFHLAFHTFRATTTATTSLVASSLEESQREAQSVTSISLKFGLVIGMCLLMSLLAGGNFALNAMGVNQQNPMYPAASRYLFTRIWAAPAVLFIGVAEGAFRGYGNTVVPLIASMTAAIINLLLDPLLMFQPIGWGVAGAAAATAFSQFGAAAVYLQKLIKQQMLLPRRSAEETSSVMSNAIEQSTQIQTKRSSMDVIRTILAANLAMVAKQGSLLFGWAFASRQATRLGAAHVAAHQVGLSVWLVFALILDGPAVSAQVLMSRAYTQKDKPAVKSLIRYMLKFALVQGLVSMLFLDGVDLLVPALFTKDAQIQRHLHKLMPKLALTQLIVSLTLVMESLAVGGNQFKPLAVGTTLATFASIWQISLQTSVEGIWGAGIMALFAGRLLTACLATWRAYRNIDREPEDQKLTVDDY